MMITWKTFINSLNSIYMKTFDHTFKKIGNLITSTQILLYRMLFALTAIAVLVLHNLLIVLL